MLTTGGQFNAGDSRFLCNRFHFAPVSEDLSEDAHHDFFDSARHLWLDCISRLEVGIQGRATVLGVLAKLF